MIDLFLAPDLDTTQLGVVTILLLVVAVGILYAISPIVRNGRVWLDERTAISIEEEDRPVRIGTVIVERVLKVAVIILTAAIVLLFWDRLPILIRSYEFVSSMFPLLSRFGLTGLLIVGAIVSIRSMHAWVERTTGHARQFNKHDQEIIKRIVQLLILVATILLILTVWRIDISGLLLGAGAMGVILGYAARDTIGSIVAGFVLMFSRPFEIGDWIVIGENRGIVTDITIVNTRIRSPEGEHVIIPNTEINSQVVRNRSHERRIRFHVDVGIDFGSDIEHAQDIAIEAIEDLDIVADTPFPSVLVDHLEDSAVVLRIRFWVDRANTEKMWRAEHKVLQAVTEAFDREGVHIPYPHQRFVNDRKPNDRRDEE